MSSRGTWARGGWGEKLSIGWGKEEERWRGNEQVIGESYKPISKEVEPEKEGGGSVSSEVICASGGYENIVCAIYTRSRTACKPLFSSSPS